MRRTSMTHAIAVLFLGGFLSFQASASAQEHPTEHPSPAKPAKAALTVKELAQAITEYVTSDAEMKGGYFLVYDPISKTPLALTLDRVHEERLSSLGGGVYFACADFKTPDDTAYDMDVFMKENGGGLQPTEVHIHKVGGKPRYTWEEASGVWVRKEVE